VLTANSDDHGTFVSINLTQMQIRRALVAFSPDVFGAIFDRAHRHLLFGFPYDSNE
jgi:hypothetical protein